jgi:preprotein translocase subunit SecD
MVRRNVVKLVFCLVLVGGAFAATLISGNTPVLGLDLRGGVSVVLSPVGKYKQDSLDVAVNVIRNRAFDCSGVGEPEISRQGKDIVVDLPGVKDRKRCQDVVGQTAELRFRPVLANLPPESATPTTTTKPASTSTTGTGETTTVPPTTTTAPSNDAAARAAIASCDQTAISALTTLPTTKPADDAADKCVVLPFRKGQGTGRLLLGPTVMTGKDVSGASSQFQAGVGYAVNMNLKDSGLTKFNALAQKAYGQTPPTNEVAIVLDSIVQSNPAFQTNSFSGPVQITGGSAGFKPSDASDLAKLINYGALPVRLDTVNVENVSPSLGSDQLRAGIIAGIIGLALVALYMIFYYRLLGLVVIIGLCVSGAALYSLVVYLGQHNGLTLTLAGVTGIIVSVGVTVDSYVVYYERLKDEVRQGGSVRSSVDRAFNRSFRTILAADLVSLISAVVLYALAIGSVRGFAFFLGLSTLLDLFVAYFFMHPLVSILGRNPRLVRMHGVGIAAGLDVREAIA